MKIKLRDLTREQYQKWQNKKCNGGMVMNARCKTCLFRKVTCSYGISLWIDDKDLYSDKFLDQEIEIEDEDENEKENIPLTDDEKATLRLVYKEYKYIARDADERLHLFKEEPFKVKGQWTNYEQYATFYPFNDYFKCVRGTDYEPTLIEDLLKGEE